MTEARRSARRWRRVSNEASGNNVPFSVEKQVGEFQWDKGIALRQVFERIALRKGTGGLWETPNQTTDGDQDKKSRLN